MDDDFMNLIPPHRTYIDQLIDKEVIEHYAVSMESQQVWITLKAENKKAIEKLTGRFASIQILHFLDR